MTPLITTFRKLVFGIRVTEPVTPRDIFVTIVGLIWVMLITGLLLI